MNTGFYIRTSGAEGYREISADDLMRIIDFMERKKSGTMSLQKYIETFIEDIALGRRITGRGRRFSKGTVDSFKQTMRKWAQYQAARGAMLDFQEVDMAVYRDYSAFLMGQNYSINTIGKCIKNLKQILLTAEADGYRIHSAIRSRNFKVHQVKTDAIYLTQSDLRAMQQLDLSTQPPHYEVARDIFLIGVWTAQRVSDYNHLSRENIGEETIAGRNIRTLSLTQQKTGKRITIPCSKELGAILDKYPTALPHLPEQKINAAIKAIGRMAGLDEWVEITTTKGGIPSKTRARKWELIHTHTARRTGATLMYLSGMDVYDICKITGHSSIQMLERYIKADELETVRKLSESYDYFK